MNYDSKFRAQVFQRNMWNDPRFQRDYSIDNTLYDRGFDDFVVAAYNSPEGYAVRWNPRTRQKEMIVAGTRYMKDWPVNVMDTFAGQTPWYRNAVRKYNRIATKEGVKVVYGHSRGGALVADMKGPYDKYGLDAAMIMANNKELKNYTGKSVFDRLIGYGGKRNIYRRSKFHKVWRR